MTADLQPEPRPTLLIVASDLFLASRLRGLAEQAGWTVQVVARLAAAADRPADRALVDLQLLNRPNGDADFTQLITAVRHVAGYGPHVRGDLFEKARAAGAAKVFTQGNLESGLPKWLQDFEPAP